MAVKYVRFLKKKLRLPDNNFQPKKKEQPKKLGCSFSKFPKGMFAAYF